MLPKDEPAGKKSDLAEQRALAGIQEKKKASLSPLEKRESHFCELQVCHWVMQGEN